MEGKNSSLNLHGDRQLKSTKVLFSVIDTKSTEKSINSRVLNGTVQVWAVEKIKAMNNSELTSMCKDIAEVRKNYLFGA